MDQGAETRDQMIARLMDQGLSPTGRRSSKAVTAEAIFRDLRNPRNPNET